eukprot:scaffold25927_cov77-Isochrysis_galbana.AAC.1
MVRVSAYPSPAVSPGLATEDQAGSEAAVTDGQGALGNGQRGAIVTHLLIGLTTLDSIGMSESSEQTIPVGGGAGVWAATTAVFPSLLCHTRLVAYVKACGPAGCSNATASPEVETGACPAGEGGGEGQGAAAETAALTKDGHVTDDARTQDGHVTDDARTQDGHVTDDAPTQDGNVTDDARTQDGNVTDVGDTTAFAALAVADHTASAEPWLPSGWAGGAETVVAETAEDVTGDVTIDEAAVGAAAAVREAPLMQPGGGTTQPHDPAGAVPPPPVLSAPPEGSPCSPLNGEDTPTTACKFWCAPQAAAAHCPYCACQACGFCAQAGRPASAVIQEGGKGLIREGGGGVVQEGEADVIQEGGSEVIQEGGSGVIQEGEGGVIQEGGLSVLLPSAAVAPLTPDAPQPQPTFATVSSPPLLPTAAAVALPVDGAGRPADFPPEARVILVPGAAINASPADATPALVATDTAGGEDTGEEDTGG